jgi:hypothetical protein
MDSTFPPVVMIVFPLLFLGAIVWIGSIFTLIRRLRNIHPETYRAMGEPRILFEYTLGQIKALIKPIKFILNREHKSLNDGYLSRLCDFMRILFVVYFAGFFGLFAYLMIVSRR